MATSSGMAAVTTILLSLMRAGDHLIGDFGRALDKADG